MIKNCNKKSRLSLRMIRGFTLLEMLVSVGIFVVIMTISTGAILLGYDSLYKIRLERQALENVNVVMESMVKKIRTGISYRCDGAALTSLKDLRTPQDCLMNPDINSTGGGNIALTFRSSTEVSANGRPIQYTYRFSENRIEVAQCVINLSSPFTSPNSCNKPDLTWFGVTSPEIKINSLRFYVSGSNPTDTLQPKVTILVNGLASLPGKEDLNVPFSLQTTVAQELLDL